MQARPKPTLNWTNLIDFVPSSFVVLELIVCPSKANLRPSAFPKTRLYWKCIMLQTLPVFHDSHCKGLLKLVHVHFDRAKENTQRTCTDFLFSKYTYHSYHIEISYIYIYIYIFIQVHFVSKISKNKAQKLRHVVSHPSLSETGIHQNLTTLSPSVEKPSSSLGWKFLPLASIAIYVLNVRNNEDTLSSRCHNVVCHMISACIKTYIYIYVLYQFTSGAK